VLVGAGHIEQNIIVSFLDQSVHGGPCTATQSKRRWPIPSGGWAWWFRLE